MKIWLIQLGEPLPIDKQGRLYRTGTLASMLVKQEHEVTWWASTFDHAHKTQRYLQNQTIKLNNHYRLELLYGKGYQKNTSLARILHHRQTAQQFTACTANEPSPDVILSSFPTPEVTTAALDFGKRHKVPVVVDIRDLWPDAFVSFAPPSMRPLMSIILRLIFHRVNHRIFHDATGIVAISSSYLDWGLRYAGRAAQQKNDQIFYMGYPQISVSPTEKADARQRWLERGVNEKSFICCFFGTINRHFDLHPIIEAAKKLEICGNHNFQFVLCGNGSHYEYYKQLASDLKHVILPGWIDRADIIALMELAKVGLVPYAVDASMSLPNKPFEYFAGGLPILSSLTGELAQILANYDCGITYNASEPQDFLKALLQLQDNPQRQYDMSKNAHQLFNQRFSADRIYPAMIDYLEQIANGELGH